MSYQVLARKWRPMTFTDLVGQDHISTTLINAIKKERVGHAYLFVGTRGIGKTTSARIFAKALNCSQPKPDGNPCCACDNCTEISNGNSLDVIEIDGASNNGVDEIRTLRDNVHYAPAKCKYKIYIIDEVHMLTTAAWNALLKTLEEPPSHVKFLFATTEAHRILPTILSRCQRMELKRIPQALIVGRLKSISEHENIPIEDEALSAVARAANGGMRDGLSILDQLGAFNTEGQIIKETDVTEIFGLTSTRELARIADSLLSNNPRKLILCLNELADSSRNLEQLYSDLFSFMRGLLIARETGEQAAQVLDCDANELHYYREMSHSVHQNILFRVVNSFLENDGQLRHTLNKRVYLEVILLRIMRQAHAVRVEDLISRLQQMRQGGELEILSEILPAAQIQVPEEPKKKLAQNSEPTTFTQVSQEPAVEVQPEPIFTPEPESVAEVQAQPIFTPEPVVEVQPQPVVEVQQESEPIFTPEPEPIIEVQQEYTAAPLVAEQDSPPWQEPTVATQPEPIAAVQVETPPTFTSEAEPITEAQPEPLFTPIAEQEPTVELEQEPTFTPEPELIAEVQQDPIIVEQDSPPWQEPTVQQEVSPEPELIAEVQPEPILEVQQEFTSENEVIAEVQPEPTETAIAPEPEKNFEVRETQPDYAVTNNSKAQQLFIEFMIEDRQVIELSTPMQSQAEPINNVIRGDWYKIDSELIELEEDVPLSDPDASQALRNLFAARNNKSYRNNLLHQSTSFACEVSEVSSASEAPVDETKSNEPAEKRPRDERAIALWQQVLDANPKIPPHIREGLDIGGWAEGKIYATYENDEDRQISDVEKRRLNQLLSQQANEELVLELILHDANKQSPEEMRRERLMQNPLVASLLTRFDAELV